MTQDTPAMDEMGLLALARAYDREDASQRGEPSPWDDGEDDATWRAERIACAKAGRDAYLAATARDAPAVRNDEAGFIEFVNSDVPYVVREIDGKAAIILDMVTRQVIGYRVYDPAAALKASQEAEVVKGKAWRDIATQAEHVALGIASGAPTTEATRVLIDLIRSTWRDPQPSPEADGDAA